MTEVKVYSRGLQKEELQSLLKLVEVAGCAASDVEVVTSIGSTSQQCDDEALIVLLTPSVLANEDLQALFMAMQNTGGRVICIWPFGAAQEKTPIAVTMYAYSLIPWDQEQLRRALADDDDVIFEMPSGESCPAEEEKHYVCK